MVNINDMKAPEVQGDKLEAIFARQKELMDKYHVIEHNNGFKVFSAPVNINDAHAQAKIKDFFWRATEEITEATEALKEEGGYEHYVEELLDALHFYVEVCILVGITPKRISTPKREGLDRLDDICSRFLQQRNDKLLLALGAYDFIESIGKAANCLKNKPWKQTQMLTDEPKFKDLMVEAFYDLVELLVMSGLSAQDIHDIYFKKSEVNKFRQSSKY